MLRRIHRTSAVVLLFFVTAHLANHLCALGGVTRHIAVMESLRPIYRNAAGEFILIVAALSQIATGLILVWRGRKMRRGFLAKLQAYSGIYLALFLLQHISAVFFGRLSQSLDTNFYYAAAVLQGGPHQYYFFPYYFLGVFALFAHLGVALNYRLQYPLARYSVVAVFLGIGLICALLILLAFGGALYEVRLPPAYVIGR
ncbi:MAG: hypothetical protein JNJ69_09420 [Leptospiraceae bacterium]|nr:hypothetical protein [Leptospiraceae bacterium]